MDGSDSECNASTRHLFAVDFVRDDGQREWWGLYFIDASEARRWAQHELGLRRRRKGRWWAQIYEGRWDAPEPHFSEAFEVVEL